MFENLIAEILNRLLGSYVTSSSFQADRVSTSVYQGHVLLSKLELRPDALDRLLLPITLKRGTINTAEISIPWTALGSKSLEINLDGVVLVLNPKTDWTDEELERRAQASKAAMLLQAEMVRNVSSISQQQQQSFTSRLMDKMFSNVIIRVRNVQIRFETLHSSFSLTLKQCALHNADANWNPVFSQDPYPLFQLCKLDQVALFDEDRQSFILLPVDLSVKMQRTREAPLNKKYELAFSQPVQIFVVHEQLESLVEIAKLRVFSKHRPVQSPLLVPKQWWSYVKQIVLKQVRERLFKRTKQYFAKRRRERLEYTFLWKQMLIKFGDGGKTGLAPVDKARLEGLERSLELTDILLFRAYAENELRLERAHQELWEMSNAAAIATTQLNKLQQQQQQQQQPTSESGWISWALGMVGGSANQKGSLSQQDVERFLALLRFNPAKSVLEADVSGNASGTGLGKAPAPRWLALHVPVLSIVWSPKLRIRVEDIEFEYQRRAHWTNARFSIAQVQVFDVLQQVVAGGRNEASTSRSSASSLLLLRPAIIPEEEVQDQNVADDSIQKEAWLDLAELNPGQGRGGEEEDADEDGRIISFTYNQDAQLGSRSISLTVGSLETVLTPLLLSRAQDLAKLISVFRARRTRSKPSHGNAHLPPIKSTNLLFKLHATSFKLPLLTSSRDEGKTPNYAVLSLASCTIKDQIADEDALSSSDEDEEEREGGGDITAANTDQYLIRLSDVKVEFVQQATNATLSSSKSGIVQHQLMDPLTIKILVHLSKRRGVAASYRVDIPELINLRLFPNVISYLYEHFQYWQAASASLAPRTVVSTTSWARSWLVMAGLEPTAEEEQDREEFVFNLDASSSSAGGGLDEQQQHPADSFNNPSDDAVSDFFTVYDEFVDSMSEVSRPVIFGSGGAAAAAATSAFPRPLASMRDTESHYSFFTADSRRTKRSVTHKRSGGGKLTSRLPSIATARTKTSLRVKIPGIRVHFYDLEPTAAAQQARSPSSPFSSPQQRHARRAPSKMPSSAMSSPRNGNRKWPLQPSGSSVASAIGASTAAAPAVPMNGYFQDWLNEVNATESAALGWEGSIQDASHHGAQLLLLLRLDRLELEWSQQHHHFSLGQVSCKSTTTVAGGRNEVLDTYLFSSEFALDEESNLISADHSERAVFFSIDWGEENLSSIRTHFPLDIITPNLDKLYAALLPPTRNGGVASSPHHVERNLLHEQQARTMLHSLLSLNQVRVWFPDATFFTLSNLELALKRDAVKFEVKGRVGNVSGHRMQNCFYSKLALEEEDLFSIVHVFPQVEARPMTAAAAAVDMTQEEDDDADSAGSIHDEVLDSMLGKEKSPIKPSRAMEVDVWQQGTEITINLAPVRVNVPALLDFAKQFPAHRKVEEQDAATASKHGQSGGGGGLVRIQMNILQPEFELGFDGVSLVCERIYVANKPYYFPASPHGADSAIVQRWDAFAQQISLLKEGSSSEQKLAFIDPCLLEVRLRRVGHRVLVSFSDLVINVDQDQLALLKTLTDTGKGAGREKPKSESKLVLSVELSRVRINLITYSAPSLHLGAFSANPSQSNFNGLVVRRSAAEYRPHLLSKSDGSAHGRRAFCIATILGESISTCHRGDVLQVEVKSFALLANQHEHPQQQHHHAPPFSQQGAQAHVIRVIDLQEGFEFSKQARAVRLKVDGPKFRYDKGTIQAVRFFFSVLSSGSDDSGGGAGSTTTSSSNEAAPPPLSLALSISNMQISFLPPLLAAHSPPPISSGSFFAQASRRSASEPASMLVINLSTAKVCFTSLSDFSIELLGVSVWLRDDSSSSLPADAAAVDAKLRFVCFPFNATMPSTGPTARQMHISPLLFQATRRDYEYIWHLLSSSSSIRVPSPSQAKTTRAEHRVIEAKLHIKSIDFVLLSEFTLPVARLVLGAFELNSTRSLLHGRVKVKAEFYKRQCWQVLMEQVAFAFHLNDSHMSVSSTDVMEWNLCESVLDDQLDGRVKIKRLVNQTGLSAERVPESPAAAATWVGKDFFCSVGELLTFRLSNDKTGASLVLRQVPCPKPGQCNKLALGANRDAFVVMETRGDALILRSLLQMRNESANQMEIYVAEPPQQQQHLPSRPDTPTTTTSTAASSMEDLALAAALAASLTPSRRRVRFSQAPGVLWSCQLFPNESVNLPPNIAHLVLVHGYSISIRPHATWGMADYEFKEVKVSHSARQNEKRLKRFLSFGEELLSTGSSLSGVSGSGTVYAHYALEGKWIDPFAQCLVLSAPLILVNHLNCAATYCLSDSSQYHGNSGVLSHIPRCEGQLPVGAELKWHGVLLPAQLSQLRLSLKLAGYEWSEPMQLCSTSKCTLEMELKDESNRSLRVNARVVWEAKQRVEITFSVPYWIVNKTQLPVLCSSSLSFGLAAGQTKVLATMRRIRLQNQMQQQRGGGTTPTGLLEILQDEGTGGSGSGTGGEEESSMLLFNKPDLKIRFWNSRWSTTSCVFEHSSHCVLECKQEWKLTSPGSPRALYVVAAKVSDSKFPETKIVTLTPRFIIVNALDRAVRVRQAKPRLQQQQELGASTSGFSSFRSHPVFSGGREPLIRADGARSEGGTISLFPGARSSFHWRDKSAPKQISACFEEFGWEWSSGVEIDDCVGEFCARLRNRLTHHVYILRVEVQVEDYSIVVTLREELPQLPPYRIDNLSLFTLQFRQMGTSEYETLLPYHSSAYSWDVLNEDRRLVVEALPRRALEEDGAGAGSQHRLASLLLPSTSRRAFDWFSPTTWFARPKELGVFSLDLHVGFLPSGLPHLSVSLQADGPTRVLTICDSRVIRGEGALALVGAKGEEEEESEEVALPPQVALASAAAATAGNTRPSPSLGFLFKIGGIGVSLVEDGDNEEEVKRRELVRVFISHPSLAYSRQVPLESAAPVQLNNSLTKAAQAASQVCGNVFELRLRDVQIDNQLLSATYPVLMCFNTSASRLEKHEDLVMVRLVKSNRFADSLEFLKSFSVHIAPIQLNLDAEILQSTMRLAKRVGRKLLLVSSLPQQQQQAQRRTPTTASAAPIAAATGAPSSTAPALTHATAAAAGGRKKIYVEDLRIDAIHIRVNFRGVFSLLGTSNWLFGANVEGAVLYLHPFHIAHSLLSAASDPIANRVLAHYVQSLRRHWYILISSIDLFGDPVGLGKTISQGIVSALSEIHKASLGMHPVSIAYGLGRGLLLVAKALVFGSTNSFVNICNGMTGALMFIVHSPQVRFPPPRHFFDSVAQGVAGLVVYPFEAVKASERASNAGRRRDRATALLWGTAHGLVGLVVHPLLGVLRLVTRIASAMRGAVDSTSKVRTQRNRTPRFFRPDQRIRTYDAFRAQGEEALWLVGLGRQLHWRNHVELSDTLLLVFTDSRLVIVKRRRFTGDSPHIHAQVRRLDFVRADATWDEVDHEEQAASGGGGATLCIIVLHASALAFQTLRVPCATHQLASEAARLANAHTW